MGFLPHNHFKMSRPLHLDAEYQLGLEVTAFLHLGVEVFGEHLEALNVLHRNHELLNG